MDIESLATTRTDGEYLSVNPIEINPCSILTKSGVKTWLTAERKNKIQWNYYDRYYCLLEKAGSSKTVREETEKSSLKILEKLGDPELLNPFYVKGLVVVGVQSGKTSNFNAVINRDIDSGYGLVIVLSGIMEDLRSQTQLRIENDVIGEGVIDLRTDSKGPKGVGLIKRFGIQGCVSISQVNSITSWRSRERQASGRLICLLSAERLPPRLYLVASAKWEVLCAGGRLNEDS